MKLQICTVIITLFILVTGFGCAGKNKQEITAVLDEFFAAAVDEDYDTLRLHMPDIQNQPNDKVEKLINELKTVKKDSPPDHFHLDEQDCPIIVAVRID